MGASYSFVIVWQQGFFENRSDHDRIIIPHTSVRLLDFHLRRLVLVAQIQVIARIGGLRDAKTANRRHPIIKL